MPQTTTSSSPSPPATGPDPVAVPGSAHSTTALARFIAAEILPTDALQAKAAELRRAMEHLRSSNEQLRPFAEGEAAAIDPATGRPATPGAPDRDAIDAIQENELVLARFAERVDLIRAEVEARGLSGHILADDDAAAADNEAADGASGRGDPVPAVGAAQQTHPAWQDGTFETGTLRSSISCRGSAPVANSNDGEGATMRTGLADRQLAEALEGRVRELEREHGDDRGGDGMHL